MDKTLRELVRFTYNMVRGTTFGRTIEEEFEMFAYSGTSSRHYEYPFALGQLVKQSRRKKIKRVLDAGSYGSLFPFLAASLGFQVTGVDINKWDAKYPNFELVIADLKKLPFEDSSFDCVTAISTIEHCGLPRFREKIDRDGDFSAMQEISRVIRRHGICILTVPYGGKSYIFENKHRIYDHKRFRKLTKNFKIKEIEYYGQISAPGIYEPCSKLQAEKAERFKNGSYSVVCALMERQ